MITTLQKVQNLNTDNFKFDIGDLISEILENFKKVWALQGAIMLVLALLVTVTIGSIGTLAFSLGDMTSFFTDYNPNDISSVGIIIKMVVTIIFAGLAAPLTAGLIHICYLADTNKNFNFSTVFDYYKSSYAKEIIFSAIIITTFSTGLQTISDMLRINLDAIILPFYITIPLVIFQILISLLAFLTIPFIIYGNLNAWDAIKSSFSLSLKKFWIILLLTILVSVGIVIGFFALCIGIFFTIPLWYSMQYIIYKTIMGVYVHNELDEIGTYKN
jgi:hypothetical protein